LFEFLKTIFLSAALIRSIQWKKTENIRVRKHSSGKWEIGWWDYARFADQVTDFIDLFEFLYPDYQLLLEVDHSSGHAKLLDDGLHVSNINSSFDGKQKLLRSTTMDMGCLGNHPAVMMTHDGQHHNVKLVLTDVQSLVFLPDDPPPFYALCTPKYDTPMSEYLAANPDLAEKAA